MSTFSPITDLNVIRDSLKQCEEITLPYKLNNSMWIKYITVVGEDEAFFQGGYFRGMGDHKMRLYNNKCVRNIPTCIRSDDGEIMYRTRFFIDTTHPTTCQKDKDKLQATIKAQQSVIERASKQLKLLEDKHHQTECDNCELRLELEDKNKLIQELQTNEKKYKLLLSQYIG